MNMPQTIENLYGKKVFFLYPHSVIRNELLDVIVMQEYEVYLLDDHEYVLKLIKIYPDAILFVNIDEKLSEQEWQAYIKGIINNEKTANVRIGILTYNENKKLAKKYLMELMVPCGFITLKAGLAESTKIFLKTLETNEAKGRRKFVRASCIDSNMATFNIKTKTGIFAGSIIDISSVGMACNFSEKIDLGINSVIDDIQLNLKGSLCRLTGRVAGIHEVQGISRYVIMFSDDTDGVTKKKIHTFVHNTLQKEIMKKQQRR